jgi:hypothetical protein
VGNIKFSRWSDDERRQLTEIINIGKTKARTVHESCMIAARKLNRTVEGCQWQYYNVILTNVTEEAKPEAIAEPVRRLAGRPKGAKNKPKVEEVKEVAPVEEVQEMDALNAEPTVEEVIPAKVPVIKLYANFGDPEPAEIISITDDVIVARCKGFFITIER